MLCKVTIQDQIYEYESGTSFEEIARDLQDTCEHTIVLVFEDGRLRELHHHLKRDCEISFITTADKIGFETYRRSCSMLFLSSVNRLYGDAVKNVILHFSVSDGFYYTIGGDVELNEKEIARITKEMRTMVEYELPIRKYSVNTFEARRLFTEAGMQDKAKLFRTRIASRVNLYSLYGYEDYYYGFMVPNTRLLTAFELIPYHDGVVLRMPRRSDPEQVGEFRPSEKLFRARIESERWAEQMGLSSCVRFMGEVQDIERMYQAMDVFVMPSFHEGLPVSCVEIQASGVPCVLSDTITEEIRIEDSMQFLSLSQSPEEWAEAVLSKKGCRDLDGCENVIRSGYAIRDVAEGLLKMYKELN